METDQQALKQRVDDLARDLREIHADAVEFSRVCHEMKWAVDALCATPGISRRDLLQMVSIL